MLGNYFNHFPLPKIGLTSTNGLFCFAFYFLHCDSWSAPLLKGRSLQSDSA